MANPSPLRLTPVQWTVCVIAAIGFAFDTYELLMLPVIAGPALAEILQVPANNPLVTQWVGNMLWMTALCGGIFGLLGGWLTDRLGRRNVMVGSIILYSVSPVLAALSTSLFWFVFFRCATFVGVCVEFVAAITWLAELFPDKRQKQLVLGWTQAFASVGGLLVTTANMLAVKYASVLPALPLAEPFDAHASWRYTLMTGLLPAIPIALLLPFAPESPVWKEKRKAGTLRRPRLRELFSPQLRRVTLVTAGLSACAYGAAFGALQVTPTRVAPGLADMAEHRKELKPLMDEAAKLNTRLNELDAELEQGSGDPEPLLSQRQAVIDAIAANRAQQQPHDVPIKARGNQVQLYQELGGLAGRIALALLLVAALSRRTLLRIFQLPGLLVVPLTYVYLFRHEPELFQWGMAAAGFLTVAQFSYFGELLPKVFPLHLRGTGGSFATNVGGRMLGTSAAYVTTNLVAPFMDGANTFEKVALAAAVVGTAVFLLGFVLSFFLPNAAVAHGGEGEAAPQGGAAPQLAGRE